MNKITAIALMCLMVGCEKLPEWVKLPWDSDGQTTNAPIVIPPVEPEPTPVPTPIPPVVETPLPPLPARVFKETNGVVSMEAEFCTSQTGYNRYFRADASGQSVMRADGPTGSSLNFSFSVKQSGTWYFWVRAYADSHLNNGMQLALNGKRVSAPTNHPLAGASDVYLQKVGWSWQPQWLKGENHVGPITLQLPTGNHTLSIVKRKSENPLIDKIMLTKSPTAPSGFRQ